MAIKRLGEQGTKRVIQELKGKANKTHTHTLDDVTETTSKKIMTSAEREQLSRIADTAVSVDMLNTELAKKVDVVAGMGLSQVSFTTIQRKKLDEIEIGANKYVHPKTHSLDIIEETTTKKIMTSAERTKLSGIANNANNYTHPSSHAASIITESTSRRFVTDTEKTTWNAKIGTHGTIKIERIAVIQNGESTAGIPNNTLILELE